MNVEIRFVLSMWALTIAIMILMYAETILVLKNTKSKKQMDMRFAGMCLIVLSFITFWLCNNHQFNYYNNFSYFAKSLLEGRLSVELPAYLESVEYQGMQYMHFAPGPAILSIPFVAIWGVDGFNCTYLAMLLGACNLPLAMKVLFNMGIAKTDRDRFWLGLMLTFGTVHFFCASQGSSWFIGHVATLFFLLLAFCFLTDNTNRFSTGNLFLAGLFFGFAVTCRLAALFGFVFATGYLWLYKKEKKEGIRNILLFCCGAAVFGSLYMTYNYVRYGTIMDMGYHLTYLKDYHRENYDILQRAPVNEQRALLKQMSKECGGPLQTKFIKYNLFSVFFMAPQFQTSFPFIIPAVTGVAVTFTSPMLYCGILADKKDKLTWILMATTLITAIPFLLNYGNGMAQFGMRYSMDFTPYLWLLMCLALTKKGNLRWWMKIGIAICILINGWGTLYWTCFYS